MAFIYYVCTYLCKILRGGVFISAKPSKGLLDRYLRSQGSIFSMLIFLGLGTTKVVPTAFGSRFSSFSSKPEEVMLSSSKVGLTLRYCVHNLSALGVVVPSIDLFPKAVPKCSVSLRVNLKSYHLEFLQTI